MKTNKGMTKQQSVAGCLWLIVWGIVFGPVLYGYVTMRMWAWFIVPLFHVQSIRMATAVGLSLFAGLFIPQPPPNSKSLADAESDPSGTFFKKTLEGILKPLIILMFGALWHAYGASL